MAEMRDDSNVALVRISSTSHEVTVIAEDRSDVSVEGDANINHEGETTTLDSIRGRVLVRLPRGTAVVVGTTSGSVHLLGPLGDVSVVTESGRVAIETAVSVDARAGSSQMEIGVVANGCRVRTSSGRVVVGGCRDADVATESGRITVSHARGSVRAHCVSGRIDISLDEAGAVDAETVSGRVTVSLPHGVRAHVHAEPSDSTVLPEGYDCVVHARSVSGRVDVSSR